MLDKLFTSKEVLKHDIGYCRLYDIKSSKGPCTKMYFVGCTPQKYEFLKNVAKHHFLPVFRITTHSIFTKHVIPFASIFDRRMVCYNTYVIAKVRDALEYLHKNLGLEHGNIVMDALFVDDYGNILVGKLDRSKEFKSADDDIYLLNELSLFILGHEQQKVVEIPHIFRILESKTSFDQLKTKEKISFVKEFMKEKENMPDCVVNVFFKLILSDLSTAESADYKKFLLEIIEQFGEDFLVNFSKELFSILDSPVRLYLLRNLVGFKCLDSCVQEISLGLRVKNMEMRLATVSFIFGNEDKFTTESFSELLKCIREDVHNTETVSAICAALMGLRRNDVYKGIYRVLIAFIKLGKARGDVYRCMDHFFPFLDKHKICNEAFPLLCSLLCCAEAQDACFALVEKMLNFLKTNKEGIRGKEWTLKGIGGIFSGKSNGSQSYTEKAPPQIIGSGGGKWSNEDMPPQITGSGGSEWSGEDIF